MSKSSKVPVKTEHRDLQEEEETNNIWLSAKKKVKQEEHTTPYCTTPHHLNGIGWIPDLAILQSLANRYAQEEEKK